MNYNFYRKPYLPIFYSVLAATIVVYLRYKVVIDKDVTIALVFLSFAVGFWYIFTPYVSIKENELRINNSPLHIVILPHTKITQVQTSPARITLYDQKQHYFSILLYKVFGNKKALLQKVLQERYPSEDQALGN